MTSAEQEMPPHLEQVTCRGWLRLTDVITHMLSVESGYTLHIIKRSSEDWTCTHSLLLHGTAPPCKNKELHLDHLHQKTMNTSRPSWRLLRWLLPRMHLAACFTLLTSAVHAGLLWNRSTCPQVCDASQCRVPPQVCYYGQVKDGCGCCVVCAAGEGELCGESSGSGLSCGEGLRCDSVLGELGKPRGSCVCSSLGPVCGSDGRTYPSICRLTAENRRAELGDHPAVILIQRGGCDSGEQPPPPPPPDVPSLFTDMQGRLQVRKTTDNVGEHAQHK